MKNKRNLTIILGATILSIIFIFIVLPQVYFILIFFNIDFFIRLIILIILIPAYFALILWLLLSEMNVWTTKKINNNKFEEDNEKTDKEMGKQITEKREIDVDVNVRLIYNSVEKILKETNEFSIKELAEMLDIDLPYVKKILEYFISEGLFKGRIKGDTFYLTQ